MKAVNLDIGSNLRSFLHDWSLLEFFPITQTAMNESRPNSNVLICSHSQQKSVTRQPRQTNNCAELLTRNRPLDGRLAIYLGGLQAEQDGGDQEDQCEDCKQFARVPIWLSYFFVCLLFRQEASKRSRLRKRQSSKIDEESGILEEAIKEIVKREDPGRVTDDLNF